MSRIRDWPWRWIAPAGLMIALAASVFLLGLLSDGASTADDEAEASASASVAAQPAPTVTARPDGDQSLPSPSEVPALPTTEDPDVYAKSVAELIFSRDWQQHPDDYRAALYAGLDPEYVLGTDARAAIIATLDSRVPEPWLWERMVGAKQTNTFQPQHVWEPEVASDPRALEEWPVGVVVRNVQGVQTLHYLDERRVFRTDQLTATVTVYMVCPPAREACTLLGVPREVEQ